MADSSGNSNIADAALDANQQQQDRPGDHWPVNANPRPRQQNSAEPLQNLRNGETENDGNKNREITKLVHARDVSILVIMGYSARGIHQGVRSDTNGLAKTMQSAGSPGAMTGSQHVYEVRPHKDHRGVNLISACAAI